MCPHTYWVRMPMYISTDTHTYTNIHTYITTHQSQLSAIRRRGEDAVYSSQQRGNYASATQETASPHQSTMNIQSKSEFRYQHVSTDSDTMLHDEHSRHFFGAKDAVQDWYLAGSNNLTSARGGDRRVDGIRDNSSLQSEGFGGKNSKYVSESGMHNVTHHHAHRDHEKHHYASRTTGLIPVGSPLVRKLQTDSMYTHGGSSNAQSHDASHTCSSVKATPTGFKETPTASLVSSLHGTHSKNNDAHATRTSTTPVASTSGQNYATSTSPLSLPSNSPGYASSLPSPVHLPAMSPPKPPDRHHANGLKTSTNGTQDSVNVSRLQTALGSTNGRVLSGGKSLLAGKGLEGLSLLDIAAADDSIFGL